MSRGSVRTAIRDYIVGGAITNLNTVYKAQPTVPGLIDDLAFFPSGDQSQLSGAVGFVHLEGEREHRITPPATKGWKRVIYDCGFIVLFRSLLADPGVGEVDVSEAVADVLDTLLEALKARLRADRTLGGTVFSAGEGGELPGDDIRVESDLPRLNGETFEVWSVVRFTVAEWITA